MLCKSMEDCASLLRRLTSPETTEFVIDVETSGLDWRTNYSVGYVFTFGTNDGDNYYVPVRHSGNNVGGYIAPTTADYNQIAPLSVHQFEKEVAAILKERGKQLRIIGHNLHFDLRFMAKHGINPVSNTLECTMINAGLIDEYRNSYSLENCCIDAKVSAKLGGELYAHMASKFGGRPDRKQMASYWRLDGLDDLAVEYALADGISTYELWNWQRRQIDKQELNNIHDLECRTINPLHRMMMRGVKVDEDRLQQVKKIVEDRLDKAMDALPADLNTRAPSQMVKLFTDNGITDWPVTEKGNPSFAESWLLTTEIGRHVVVARKYRNLLDSFIAPMDTHIWKGRIHTEFNQSKSDQYGTVTGRLSSSRPNLQQVPKRNEELGRLFRSIFIPDDGMVWASVDYSQCEPRLLAHYSNCKVLVDGYLQVPAIDAHTAVAEAANIDRTSGKRLNQGLITGMGKPKLIQELGVSETEGNRIYNNYFNAMPEIKAIQKHAANVMQDRGFVRSILGRRARIQYFSNGGSNSYKAINRLLQCSNADIIKKAMADIDDHLSGEGQYDPEECEMLLNMHDSIDFQYAKDDPYGPLLYRECLKIMTNFGPKRLVELRVPMDVDEGLGLNWADASYGGD